MLWAKLINFSIAKNNKGFTLIEMITAVTIFAVIMTSAVGIFRGVIEGQRNAIAAQNTQESMRYALEVMSKFIRQAQKGEHYCELTAEGGAPAVSSTYNIDNTIASINGVNTGSDVLYFKNKYGNCQYYFIDNNSTLYTASSTPSLGNTEIHQMTPDEIEVSDLEFSIFDYPIGAVPGDKVQPRVTLTMKVAMRGGKDMHKNEFIIQTTLSNRYYKH